MANDISSILAANPFYLGPPGTSRNMPGFADAARQATAMQNPALAASLETGTPPPTPMKNGQQMGTGTGVKWDPSLPVSEQNNPYTPQTQANSATISRWQRVMQHPEEYPLFLKSIGVMVPPGAKYDFGRLQPQVLDMITNLITRAAAGIGGGFEDFRGFLQNQANHLLINPLAPKPWDPGPPTTPLPEDQKPTVPSQPPPKQPPSPQQPQVFIPPTTPPQQEQPPAQPQPQIPPQPTISMPGAGTRPIEPEYRQVGTSMLNAGAQVQGGQSAGTRPSGSMQVESGQRSYRDAGSRLAARRTRDPFATRRR